MGRRKRLTRARTSPDMGRLANAVSRPGIDPRVWLTLAVVLDVGYDANEGIFADVQFQPDGTVETCLLGAPYAGAEFGAYFPVNVDDTVLVAVPSGDPSTGPTLIARMWNSGDKPHADFQSEDEEEEPTKDVVLRIQPGRKLKIRTSDDGDGVDITVEGNGDVVIQATGDGKVFIGGTDGTQPSTLADTLTDFLNSQKTKLDTAINFLKTHVHIETGATTDPPTGASLIETTPNVPDVKANEVEIK
ncbi:hypothetical protein LCGC14_0414830 [marine sediment metagenome]|uniref:Gp5/Type VI secretion system Vgr protein OB-fold domain-containing protein n=1 Tax=marine sediment metagenome TaxID=412755 RepID=A0A0F9W1Z0_9ZZZZ